PPWKRARASAAENPSSRSCSSSIPSYLREATKPSWRPCATTGLRSEWRRIEEADGIRAPVAVAATASSASRWTRTARCAAGVGAERTGRLPARRLQQLARDQYPFVKQPFGKWTLVIPPKPDGKPAIEHNSVIKLLIIGPQGQRLDRCRRSGPAATVYEQRLWNPPKPYNRASQQLRIYEAHVGISSPEERVPPTTLLQGERASQGAGRSATTASSSWPVMEHAYYGQLRLPDQPLSSPPQPLRHPPCELKQLIDAAHSMGIIVLLTLCTRDHGLQQHHRRLNHTASTDSASMAACPWLYHHHGAQPHHFSGHYDEYFGMSVESVTGVLTYLALANWLLHKAQPFVITVAEEVSGLRPLAGQLSTAATASTTGLAMAVPTLWIKLLKGVRPTQDWDVAKICFELENRRYARRRPSPTPSRTIRLCGWTSPAWQRRVYYYARRQFNLVYDKLLRYQHLNNFDAAMNLAEPGSAGWHRGPGTLTRKHNATKVVAFERGGLLFAVNWHWASSFTDYRLGAVAEPGRYRICAHTDRRSSADTTRRGREIHAILHPPGDFDGALQLAAAVACPGRCAPWFWPGRTRARRLIVMDYQCLDWTGKACKDRLRSR
uniref:Alpha-amylase_C domain-containing protein n=1 Tax=Macrostomum lignano TaxID=282301 RepID=A0A1I8FEI0_9PLAT